MTFRFNSRSSVLSTTRYCGIQRYLHWIMATAIFVALAIGIICSYLDHGSPQRQFLMDIHKSLGMTVLALLVIRIPIRASYGEPRFDIAPPLHERIASKLVHAGLYGVMLLMPVSGYVTSSAEGRRVQWFGVFRWPNLLTENKSFGRAVGAIHHYGAYAFYMLLILHLGAVVWHRLVRKDEVLARML